MGSPPPQEILLTIKWLLIWHRKVKTKMKKCIFFFNFLKKNENRSTLKPFLEHLELSYEKTSGE